MLCPALPGVAETRPNYPRDVFRRYTAHDVAMPYPGSPDHGSCRPNEGTARNDGPDRIGRVTGRLGRGRVDDAILRTAPRP